MLCIKAPYKVLQENDTIKIIWENIIHWWIIFRSILFKQKAK